MTNFQIGGKLSVPVGERDHSQGRPDAKVTLVEYGDFECSYCGKAYPIVEKVIDKLGEDLRFVFRNFPLSQIHPHAQHAAEAAEAASTQNKFWEMHGYLFKHQEALADTNLFAYAEALSLDTGRFSKELTDHTHAPRIKEDFSSGIRSGVNGTPTFFLNGVRHDGSWDFEFLLEAIEREMK
ncbi:MAG TPA: thioredoxin domain-containing protein [candidate division Zixibacteria bacterium]|nr:thioredoxin domain-containing protein [candidate division Zixibacteria bacterium]